MGGSVSRENVFEGEGCVTSSMAVIKVRYAGGYMEEFEGPITAQEIMKKRARHWVAMPDIFKTSAPHLSILAPQAQLLPGQTYFLVPFHTVYRRMLLQSIPRQDLLRFLSQQGISLSKFHTDRRSEPGCSSGYRVVGATKRTNRAKVTSHSERVSSSNYERRAQQAPADRDLPVILKKAIITHKKDQEETQNALVIHRDHAAHPKKVPTDQNSRGNQLTHNSEGATQYNPFHLHHSTSASHNHERTNINKVLPLTDNNKNAINHETVSKPGLTGCQHGVTQGADFLQRRGSMRGNLSTRSENENPHDLRPILQMENRENSPGGNRDTEIPIKRASDYYSPELHIGEPFTKEPDKESTKDGEQENIVGHPCSPKYAEPDKESNKEMEMHASEEDRDTVQDVEPHKEYSKIQVVQATASYRENSAMHTSIREQDTVKGVEPLKEASKIQEVQATGNPTLQADKKVPLSTKEQETFEAKNRSFVNISNAPFQPQAGDTSKLSLVPHRRQLEPQPSETLELQLARESGQLVTQPPFLQRIQTVQDQRQLSPPSKQHPLLLQRSRPMQDPVQLRSLFMQPPLMHRNKTVQDQVGLGPPLMQSPGMQRNKNSQGQRGLQYAGQLAEASRTPESYRTAENGDALPSKKRAAASTSTETGQETPPSSLRELMLQSSIVMITRNDVQQANMYNNKCCEDMRQERMANMHRERTGGVTRHMSRYADLNQTPINVNMRQLPYPGNQRRRMIQRYAMSMPGSMGRFRSVWKPTLQPVYEYASDLTIPLYC